MKAVEIACPGGPEVLRLAERPDPVPGEGEVLIRVRASGVNRPDVLQRKGAYPPPPGASEIPGLEVAGQIVAGDAAAMAASGLKAGDRVCALVSGGGYAELCTAPVGQCLPVPAGLSELDAAGLPETFFTVWSNVFMRGRLRGGERFLVHGGASGIGTTAIQLGRAFGVRVFATAGGPDRAKACESFGAERGIDRHTEDFVPILQAQGGADVILDMVGGPYLPRNIQALADDGRLVQIAFLQGPKAELDLNAVMRKRLTVTGSTLRPQSVAAKARIAEELRREVWPLLATGRLRPVMDREFALEDAAQAHALLESNTVLGKIVLRID